MKKISLLLLIVLAVVLVAGCGGGTPSSSDEPKAETVFVNIATGGTAGTYFPLGGGIADIWNKNIPGVNATAESTGASVANVNMLRDGKVDVIFVQNDVAFYAGSGTEIFAEDSNGGIYEGIRGLCTMYPETIQIITVKENGINTLEDLKGKKVAVGAAGSGTEANARQILNEAGITYDDLDVRYLSFSEAAQNLKDGNIDAGFITAGFPTAAVQDISAQHDLVVVPVAHELVDKLIEDYPFYTKIVIPAGTYNTVDVDVETVAVKAMLGVSETLDEQLVYDMLSTLYANPERLEAAHAKGAMITKETGRDGMSIELHPGAARFFEE